jgi:predicted Rossmann fold nucleotide-binding protein DprA/Smf involved in DNA uptake
MLSLVRPATPTPEYEVAWNGTMAREAAADAAREAPADAPEYLERRLNVHKGRSTSTILIAAMRRKPGTALELATRTGLSYGVVSSTLTRMGRAGWLKPSDQVWGRIYALRVGVDVTQPFCGGSRG